MAQPDLTQPKSQTEPQIRSSHIFFLNRLSYRQQAVGYLIALLVAEAVTTFVEPRAGMVMHGVIFFVLLLHASLVAHGLYQKFLWALSLAPLIRLLSLTMPLTSFPYVSWYLIVGAPLFLAVYTVARLAHLGANQLSLRIGKLHWQIIIAASGLGLGLIEYLILRPDPLTEELSWRVFWLPALILFIFTGFLEELIFRGVMQYTALRVYGIWGLFYVAAVFTVLHIGYQSILDLVFVFAVAVYFGWAVQKTGSLLGVTLAHGLINTTLFLVFPFLLSSPTQQLTAPGGVLAPAPNSAPVLPIPTRSPTIPPTATFTSQPSPSCNYPEGWLKVQVAPGDTLEILAQSNGTTLDVIQNGNCVSGDGVIPAGSYIFIPPRTPIATITETTSAEGRQSEPTNQLTGCHGDPAGWVIYVVKKGDTLSQISAATGATVAQLLSANCLTSTLIGIGQALYVPYIPPESSQIRRTATATPHRHPPATPPNAPADTAMPTSIPENPTMPAATTVAPTLELPTAPPNIPTDAPPDPSDTPIAPPGLNP